MSVIHVKNNAERINNLQDLMLTMPQAPAMDTSHHFHGGMYCRRIVIPAGSLIVSKTHKTDHLFIGCSGELFVTGEGDNYILNAGSVILSEIGTKRAVYALTEVICMTVHRTDKKSIDGLQDELMHEDKPSMYDVDNKPKPGVLVYDSAKQIILNK